MDKDSLACTNPDCIRYIDHRGPCEFGGDSAQFIEQVARSAHLYRRGLITPQEFTNVTLEGLHRLSNPVEPVDA